MWAGLIDSECNRYEIVWTRVPTLMVNSVSGAKSCVKAKGGAALRDAPSAQGRPRAGARAGARAQVVHKENSGQHALPPRIGVSFFDLIGPDSAQLL